MNPYTRKTSDYVLTLEVPGATDETLPLVLDAAIREAAGLTLTGSWYRRVDVSYGIHVPFVAVSFRASDDAQASIWGSRITSALGSPAADLRTGYGAHKRLVATTRPEEPDATAAEA